MRSGTPGAFGKSKNIQTVSLKEARLALEHRNQKLAAEDRRRQNARKEMIHNQNKQRKELRAWAEARFQEVLNEGFKVFKCVQDDEKQIDLWKNQIKELIHVAFEKMKYHQRTTGNKLVIRWDSDWEVSGVFKIGVPKQK